MQLQNCADTYGIQCINEQNYLYGNMKRAYIEFNRYKSLFGEYLELLNDSETIYPSKEDFLEHLFINGEYQFLNFKSLNEQNTRRFQEDNGQIITLSHFHYKEDHQSNYTKTYTRIKKGDTIKFYNKELSCKEQWNDDSCYLTLSTKQITDTDFFDAFTSKKYKGFHQEEIMEFTIHKLILKMILPKEEL